MTRTCSRCGAYVHHATTPTASGKYLHADCALFDKVSPTPSPAWLTPKAVALKEKVK